MGKKDERIGFLTIYIDNRYVGKTMLITLMKDESKMYYAPINSDLYYARVNIHIPYGNYILKIMGTKKERLISVIEPTISVDWRS
jgi:hypothetical protein